MKHPFIEKECFCHNKRLYWSNVRPEKATSNSKSKRVMQTNHFDDKESKNKDEKKQETRQYSLMLKSVALALQCLVPTKMPYMLKQAYR